MDHVLQQREKDNRSNERYYLTMIAELDEKTSKLGARDDGAARFAREYLEAVKKQLQDRLDVWRSAQPILRSASNELEIARAAFEAKRAELQAELQAALEPLSQRLYEAEKVHEKANREATLELQLIKSGFAPDRDPGSTATIAAHAPGFPSDGFDPSLRNGRCETLAFAQRMRSVPEIVDAIVIEDEVIAAAVANDDGYPATDAVAAFAFRWKHWAAAHKLEPGPGRSVTAPTEVHSVVRKRESKTRKAIGL